MSRPGYPIERSQTITVHSTYHASGVDLPGQDECFIHEFYDDKIGDNTPGWPSHIQQNAYVRATRNWDQQPLSVQGHTTFNSDTFGGNWGNSFGLSYNPAADGVTFSLSDATSDVRNKLTMRLINQLQSNKVNLGEIFETRQQTADLVGDTAGRLARAFSSLRHGNPGGAIRQIFGSGGGRGSGGSVTRHAGGVPGQWLRLKYGWQPLLQDVYNSVDTVRQAYSDTGSPASVTASASQTVPNKNFVTAYQGNWGPEITYKCTSRRVSGKASIKYRLGGGTNHSMSQLGMANPASLAWELLPYSFVVDWFLPIGQFLSSLDYAIGLVFIDGYYSIKQEQSWQSQLSRTTGTQPGYVANWSGGTGSGKAMFFYREVMDGFPFPPLPAIKNPFSPTHMANGLALLSEAFGRAL